MNNRVTFPRLIFCLLWALAFANSAEAAVSVRHPGAVGEGLPFFVRVATDEPLAAVTVRWLGKEVPATVEKRGRGSVATVLLGMGLHDKLKGASFALEVESKTASGAKIYNGCSPCWKPFLK